MIDVRATRQQGVVSALADHADALLVTHLPNIRWLTGFSGTSALLLVAGDQVTLITDFRYEYQAQADVGNSATVVIDRKSVWDRLRRVLGASSYRRLAIESQVMAVRDAERVSGLFSGRVVPVEDLVERLRQVKDEGEVGLIRAAAALAAEALDAVVPTIRSGDRELDVAVRLEAALRERGSEWHPFQTIVASGPRSALPHARSSTRRLESGDLLLIDFGARVDGYCSDLTRMAVLGPPDDKQLTLHELVREAQQRAIRGIRGGMSGKEGDALARDVIAGRGYGAEFGHSLGHGLGLEVHEAPRLAATAEAPVPTGAVVTIEPGIYLPGWGGIRLEDDLWLSPDGPVLLSDGRTDLIILDS